ncbi:hypothetical protein [Bythopirellula goksoeyrii]|uniref:Uncharacterized protein n=1 Tax=Bythopirellula goksoeyrii TaxID=1400387 RepID=A0A5B9Q9B5_9BACT|nr:hypothetical protein [Bythopirellula goksoeyrii]QEG35518.1 hypothetical protein Pr1d_28190 [Bythopirellula goksoeyrii]
MTHIRQHTFARVKWIIFALFLISTWNAIPPEAPAASGLLLELPVSQNNTPRYSKQSALRLNIDTNWIGEHGYRPVRFTFKSLLPIPADVQVTIRFFAARRWDKNPAIVVEQDFELAAGSTLSTFSVLVPEYVEWRYIGCETWVDGVQDNQLSMELVQHPRSSNSQSGYGGYNFSAMLLSPAGYLSNNRLLREIGGTPAETYAWRKTELPSTWVDYSSFDVVITVLDELESFNTMQPVRLAELLRWIRSGGNLWVFDAGKQYEQISQVEAALGISGEEGELESGSQALLERGWRFPKVDNPGTDKLEKLRQLQAPLSQLTTEPVDQDATEPQDSRKWFTTRLLGMGTVTVFAESSRFGKTAEETSWAITQSLLADRLSWVGRHGNDPDAGNDNFNDWLIPDVGTAPVTAFQALLTLFVLGIGPANYLLLKRREQLPLLLLTVPVAALATIFLLLVYSYITDGFGTIVRARSFTLLDQRSGTTACWARLSYFSGIAPANGLELPTDTLVYPILPASRTGNRRMIRGLAQQRRELHWDGTEKLIDGWLASRTPTQYLTITSREVQKQIDFEQVAEGLQATNQLGVDIRMLAVVDDEGSFYLSEEIPANRSILLPETTQNQAMMQLRKLFSDNEPQFPPGTAESISVDGNIVSLPLAQNLMETQIAAISSAISQGWNPRTFVAITEHGMDLSLGLADVTEDASFHVVRGKW